ncbi:hypothetical protein AAVH_41261, partial [Aphelenchoides avenae]
MPEVSSVKGVIIACKGLGHWHVWVDTNEVVDIFNTEFAVGDWLQIDKMVSTDGQLLVSVAKIPPVLKTVVNGGIVDLETVIVPLKEYLYTRDAKKKNHVLARSLHVGNVCITAPNRLEHSRAYLVTVRSLVAGNNPLELYLSKEYDAKWFLSSMVSRTPLTHEQVERLELALKLSSGVVVPSEMNGHEKSVSSEVGPVKTHRQEAQSGKSLQSVSVPSYGKEKSVCSEEMGPMTHQEQQSAKSLQPVPALTRTLATEAPAVCANGVVAPSNVNENLVTSKEVGSVTNHRQEPQSTKPLKPEPALTHAVPTEGRPFGAAERRTSGFGFKFRCKRFDEEASSGGTTLNHNDMQVDRSPLAGTTERRTSGFGSKFRPKRLEETPASNVLPSITRPLLVNRDQGKVTGGSDVEMRSLSTTNGFATTESSHQLQAAASSPMSTASFSSVGRTPNHNDMDLDRQPPVATTERCTSGFGLKFRQKRLEKSPSSGMLLSSVTASLVNTDRGQNAGGSDVEKCPISTTKGFATNESTHQLRSTSLSSLSTLSFASAVMTQDQNDMDVDRPPLASVNDDASSTFNRP